MKNPRPKLNNLVAVDAIFISKLQFQIDRFWSTKSETVSEAIENTMKPQGEGVRPQAVRGFTGGAYGGVTDYYFSAQTLL